MRYIATLLDLAPKECLKILDYGCGLGVTLRIFRSAGVEAIGFDPSTIRSAFVRQSGGFAVDDEDDLFCHFPFNILICDNVLEHVPDPYKTLSLLASLSTEGTLLYISVPDYEERTLQLQLQALRKSRPISMDLNPWEHLNYFNIRQLDQMLSKHGFEPIKSCDFPGHVDIGLRSEPNFSERLKNSLASALRLGHYALRGQTHRTVNNAFYRFKGSA